MFSKTLKTNSFLVLLIFWGCLLLAPTFSFAGPSQVNLNTATAEQLETLPGIGPDLAQRILDYRTDNGPFNNINGLLNVKGIGEGKLAKLRDQITVEMSDPSAKDPRGTVK
jgi:competence ComEA-like helix-hairpin-helix protein